MFTQPPGGQNIADPHRPSYGDPRIRSNATDDGYGIVPMPGIKTVSIRTKSAYGSLRETKVEFACHNQRQLEILEMLYMRPGMPVLLEWGWGTYINNKGRKISDHAMHDNSVDHLWWNENTNLIDVNMQIKKKRQSSSGNRDALVGLVKNFQWKARPDGGFDCYTELISMGEILESIKGNTIIVNQSNDPYDPSDEMKKKVGDEARENFNLSMGVTGLSGGGGFDDKGEYRETDMLENLLKMFKTYSDFDESVDSGGTIKNWFRDKFTDLKAFGRTRWWSQMVGLDTPEEAGYFYMDDKADYVDQTKEEMLDLFDLNRAKTWKEHPTFGQSDMQSMANISMKY